MWAGRGGDLSFFVHVMAGSTILVFLLFAVNMYHLHASGAASMFIAADVASATTEFYFGLVADGDSRLSPSIDCTSSPRHLHSRSFSLWGPILSAVLSAVFVLTSSLLSCVVLVV